MTKLPDEWRRKRMQDLADKFDGNAPLGRKLGYKDGAYVRQMIAGERPITEKTVLKAERLEGCTGWFSSTKAALPTPPPPPANFQDSRTLTEEQWELYQAFVMVGTPEEKRMIVDRYESLKKIAAKVYGANQGEKK